MNNKYPWEATTTQIPSCGLKVLSSKAEVGSLVPNTAVLGDRPSVE